MMNPKMAIVDITRDVLSRLEGVKEHRDYWTAICPSHDDHDPSLTIREHQDGVSVKCHAGCSTEDIGMAIGLEGQDLYPRASLELRVSPSSRTSEYYHYRNEGGDPLFRVWRTPSKKFIQQRYDDETGEWVNGLGIVTPVLYRLPELLAADPSEPVFVVEGEKDADRLISEGLIATTSPMGAGKWREEYSRCLEGRSVIVIPDNDELGEEHAKKVAQLTGATILRLPGLPRKGDASDWFDSGHTAAELVELTKDATPPENGHRQSTLSTFTLAELVSKEFPPVRWIVPGVLPEGTVLLAGKPKMGKSWMALGLCVSVATGTRPWVGSRRRRGTPSI
jgi:putative DNA primase/helicase